MRHKKIIDIIPKIIKGKQKVAFKVEGLDNLVYISPGNIKQCTGVKINEVEILINSSIRVEFYNLGEEMINGSECQTENCIVKDFWIECIGTIDEMLSINNDKLMPLKTIEKVFQFSNNGNDMVGFDTGDEKATFIYANSLKGLTKLDESNFQFLQGSFISAEYYKMGETVDFGKGYTPFICKKDDVLMKDYHLRLCGTFEEMVERYLAPVSFQSIRRVENYYQNDNEPDYYGRDIDDHSLSNNPYYDDSRDMDQQEPEFWDSL